MIGAREADKGNVMEFIITNEKIISYQIKNNKLYKIIERFDCLAKIYIELYKDEYK
jgi:hypothetical protein